MMPSLLDWWHIAAEIIEHREYKFRETRELERKSTFFSTSLRLKYPFQSVGIALEDRSAAGSPAGGEVNNVTMATGRKYNHGHQDVSN